MADKQATSQYDSDGGERESYRYRDRDRDRDREDRGGSTKGKTESLVAKYSLWVPVAAIVISWIMGLAGAGYRVGNLETRITNLEMAITELRSVPIKLTVVEVKIDESNKRQEMIEKHLERLVEMTKEGK